jgi:rfaE bifunctional protein nucleotidyltransferase chain/domain
VPGKQALGKVVSQSELILHCGEWKRNGLQMVCAPGSFDLLHPGHVRLLERARSLGDVLVVAVRSDASLRAVPTPKARAASGSAASPTPERPITPAHERAEILASLAAVDYVVEFDEPLRIFLDQLAPDVFVHGGPSPIVEAREPADAASPAFKTVSFPLEPGFSTDHLIERIKQLNA